VWTPAPELFADGEAVRASWPRMRLQLQPGENELVVRVAAPQQIGLPTVVALNRAEYRRTIRLTAGETHEDTLTAEIAEIAAIRRPDRPELAEFRSLG
jgi:hypothetical protein